MINLIKEFISSIWHSFLGLHPIYWLRSHTVTRYHIIDISGQDNYKWGWIDRDHAMYLACFKILVDFVEKEDPNIGSCNTPEEFWPDHIWYDTHERDGIQNQVNWEKEIRALYTWWTKQRPADCIKLDMLSNGFDVKFGDNGIEVSDQDIYDRYSTEKDRLEAVDEEMFQRLIKVRQHLWT
jgi:hypothetical protein